jgi:hypothetical protein
MRRKDEEMGVTTMKKMLRKNWKIDDENTEKTKEKQGGRR